MAASSKHRHAPSADVPGNGTSLQPDPVCKDVLFITTPDSARALSALSSMTRALAGCGIAGIYHAFLFGSHGTYSVWVAAQDGTPVPGSAAWEAEARADGA